MVLFLHVLLVQVSFFNPAAGTTHAETREYVLKAGFIYNFTKFIDWPIVTQAEIETSGYRFCVAGKNPFGAILERLAEKFKSKNQELIVRRDVSVAEVSRCHILFIANTEQSRVDAYLARVDGNPVLVVGDTPGFAEKGVGINFYIRENKIRFEINRDAVEGAGLQVSSELLNLAKIVSGRKRR